MNIGNNNVNFTGKFFIVGKKNPALKDPDKIINDAIDKSVEAGNAIIKHCRKNDIPCFFDEFTIESGVLPQYRRFTTSDPLTVDEIPEDIVAHSFLTGEDAKLFNPVGGYFPSDMKIPKENKLDAAEVLKAIKDDLFDFVKGEYSAGTRKITNDTKIPNDTKISDNIEIPKENGFGLVKQLKAIKDSFLGFINTIKK